MDSSKGSIESAVEWILNGFQERPFDVKQRQVSMLKSSLKSILGFESRWKFVCSIFTSIFCTDFFAFGIFFYDLVFCKKKIAYGTQVGHFLIFKQ